MSPPSPDGRGRPSFRLDRRPVGSPPVMGPGVSGRMFVAGAVLGLLATWGGVYLAFDTWRAGVRERIAFGKGQVAPVVLPLSRTRPSGIAAADWHKAVVETEAMLVEVVGTGRLDRPSLEALRSDLIRQVADAHRDPETAPAVLAGIWDEMARLKRLRDETERPEVLPPPRSDAGSPEPGR